MKKKKSAWMYANSLVLNAGRIGLNSQLNRRALDGKLPKRSFYIEAQLIKFHILLSKSPIKTESKKWGILVILFQ